MSENNSMFTKFGTQSKEKSWLDTRMEPENPTDKYVVCVENNGNVVGHLTKGNNGRINKTIFFFLRADEYGS